MCAQLSKVDPILVLTNERVRLGDETRMSLSVKEATEWLSKLSEAEKRKKYSFVSEMFYLTHFSLHIGLVSSIVSYRTFLPQLHHLQSRIKQLQATRNTWGMVMSQHAKREHEKYLTQ